ncbi:MAG TPA: hypothetical protein EYP04_04250 [Anaerolineae bacterium]|nr:hypothetical protein [Anaerolineae bacterium]HIQ06394.1 hypothetical protein [Anaerolineae bacterium]
MRILAIIQGEYGQRHVDNIRRRGPTDWVVNVWRAPAALPPVIDEPEEFLPSELPPADLILAAGEHPGVASLLPEVVAMTGAQAVIAPVDNVAWLPKGLAAQVARWLEQDGIAAVFPKPFCSLTERTYNVRRFQTEYDHPLIAEFARHFGRPKLNITVDPESRQITAVEVERDACCGCTSFVAERLIGVSADEAEEKAGLLHHHFPCLASMGKDPDFNDTLMHVSGHLLRDEVAEQVRPFRRVQYLRPQGKVE